MFLLAQGLGAEWVSAIANAVLALAAIVGGYFAFREFSNAQKWKRVEVAAQYVEKLWTDHKIQACCIFLDWSERRMKVPEDYEGLMEGAYFTHSTAALRAAMNSVIEDGKTVDASVSFSWQEVMYRDYFDRFFEYLVQCNDALDLGLIEERDFAPLVYWLERLMDGKDGSIFKAFIGRHKYHQVETLHDRLQRAGVGAQKRA